MGETLHSVGIDVGTSTTQLIFSRLTVENRANAYAVPDFTIGDREILYRSPIHFTPLLSATRLDAAGIRQIVAEEYRLAGIEPQLVSTGAIIITGETARKENARAVLDSLKEFAGEFVVATAGPDLESVLAAKGAGAERFSAQTGKTVLHMDIGGGTSNLALVEAGHVTETGCLNVGGRLIKVAGGVVQYVSPVLQGLCHLGPGQRVTEADLAPTIERLVQALEVAAGLRQGEIPPNLLTNRQIPLPPGQITLSFSGGVADLIRQTPPDAFAYGDIGVLLGRAIRRSALCQGTTFWGRKPSGHRHRSRMPQHPTLRQHRVRPGRQVPSAKSACPRSHRPRAESAHPPSGGADCTASGPVGGGLPRRPVSPRPAQSGLR